MKLRNHQFSTQPRIFDGGYKHPWYEHVKHRISDDCPEDMKEHAYNLLLNKPNPPTVEAVKRAKFVDKTYHWSRDSNTRPRKQRVTK
jgi:hypothetical protein